MLPWVIAIALVACSSSPPRVELAMDFTRASFYDAPFPSDDVRDLAHFPDPDHPALMEQARALLAGADGFARTGAIYFRATGALDETSLPDLAGSIADDAAVYLVPAAGGAKRPIDVAFLANGGPYGAPNMLALLPLQGAPLAASTTYVAVVTTKVRAADGSPLAAIATPQLDAYRTALAALAVDPQTIAGLAVFTTGNPTAGLAAARADALAHVSTIPTPAAGDRFADYCVFTSTIAMPVYQAGTPPYATDGGGWAATPTVDHVETARVVLTIPRGPTPAGGWPLAVFVRTGGGGDRPLVDRGACATPEFTMPIVAGSGPARDLARVGFAGAMVDGPLGGIRNPVGADEEFLIFNVQNATALRDNIRQSALELSLFAHAVTQVTFDASSCAGAGQVRFDAGHVALIGHSMGAWIAPLALAVEPMFGAAVLSGAGASYIANIVDKQKPIAPLVVVASLLDLPRHGDPLTTHDPALTIVQWAAEPADPQVYDPGLGRSVLMLQGIVDHYILPSIANSTSLALGLDAAGPMYDASSPELAGLGQPALAPLLPLVGRSAIALPAAANIDARTTAVVVQHPGDAIEDGHEMMFQTEAAKHQYRCFLASWLRGVPTVPVDGAADDPCP